MSEHFQTPVNRLNNLKLKSYSQKASSRAAQNILAGHMWPFMHWQNSKGSKSVRSQKYGGLHRGVTGGKRGTIPRGKNHYGGAEKSQQCHKYFLQYRYNSID